MSFEFENDFFLFFLPFSVVLFFLPIRNNFYIFWILTIHDLNVLRSFSSNLWHDFHFIFSVFWWTKFLTLMGVNLSLFFFHYTLKRKKLPSNKDIITCCYNLCSCFSVFISYSFMQLELGFVRPSTLLFLLTWIGICPSPWRWPVQPFLPVYSDICCVIDQVSTCVRLSTSVHIEDSRWHCSEASTSSPAPQGPR